MACIPTRAPTPNRNSKPKPKPKPEPKPKPNPNPEQVWPLSCEPSLYRLGLPPVQGCSPLSAEAREYAHHATGGRHAQPEEASLLRPEGGEVGCGRIVRDGLLDRKEQP